MKLRLMTATAALALMTGGAFAQAQLTSPQQTALESGVTPATVAGSEVIPTTEATNWDVGGTVPDTYSMAALDIDGLEDFGYVRTDETMYVLDRNRTIVHSMNVPTATGVGSETIPPASGDRPDVASPTNQ